jgi:hypothetical protein
MPGEGEPGAGQGREQCKGARGAGCRQQNSRRRMILLTQSIRETARVKSEEFWGGQRVGGDGAGQGHDTVQNRALGVGQ